MAKFKFHCRACGQKILAEENAIGTSACCPNCGAVILVCRDADELTWASAELCLERYRILGNLPSCDIGRRYIALDPVRQVRVMLYELPETLSGNQAEMDFVQSAARKMRLLQHPNAARILDLQQDRTNGKFFLVTEYVSGVSLAFWSRLHREAGIMNIHTLLPLCRQLADVLDYAHQAGIVHRGLTPENILVTPEGGIKLLYFGLSETILFAMARLGLRHPETNVSANYAAPEQWRSYEQGFARLARTIFYDIRAAADQYALAVMIYEMLSECLPLTGSTVTEFRENVLTRIPQPIPGISKAVNQALARALSKNPEDRFSCCWELVTAMPDDPAQAGTDRSLDDLSFKFHCPCCRRKIRTGKMFTGMTLICPDCKQEIAIAPDPELPEGFKFHCPHCRQKIRAPGRKVGSRLTCPGCGQVIEVQPDPPEIQAETCRKEILL